MTEKKRELSGVYPILATTFSVDGAIDMDSQLRLVDYLIGQGSHGLGLFGNASEGYALTGEERRRLQREIVRTVNGRVPLVVSTGATSSWTAVESSREAEDLGADALMVVPPYLMKTDGDGILRYFAAIGEAVKIPIMVQDAPLMTQVALPPALLARLHREVPNVQYVKVEAPPTAPKFTHVRAAATGSLRLFGGLNGQFLIEEMQRGAVGTMPGSDLTSTFVAIWNAMQAGDLDQAWKLFTRALPLMRFELQPGMGVSAMKHNLVSDGVIACAAVREPTVSLSAESLRELEFLRAHCRD